MENSSFLSEMRLRRKIYLKQIWTQHGHKKNQKVHDCTPPEGKKRKSEAFPLIAPSKPKNPTRMIVNFALCVCCSHSGFSIFSGNLLLNFLQNSFGGGKAISYFFSSLSLCLCLASSQVRLCHLMVLPCYSLAHLSFQNFYFHVENLRQEWDTECTV